jgi:hypothetical protein
LNAAANLLNLLGFTDGFPDLNSSAKPSMSSPSKACNILGGRISFIGVNAKEENPVAALGHRLCYSG